MTNKTLCFIVAVSLFFLLGCDQVKEKVFNRNAVKTIVLEDLEDIIKKRIDIEQRYKPFPNMNEGEDEGLYIKRLKRLEKAYLTEVNKYMGPFEYTVGYGLEHYNINNRPFFSIGDFDDQKKRYNMFFDLSWISQQGAGGIIYNGKARALTKQIAIAENNIPVVHNNEHRSMLIIKFLIEEVSPVKVLNKIQGYKFIIKVIGQKMVLDEMLIWEKG